MVRDDVLLEEGRQHDRGGASVFESQHHVEVVGQGRRARHERVREGESEISRCQIHQRALASAV